MPVRDREAPGSNRGSPKITWSNCPQHLGGQATCPQILRPQTHVTAGQVRGFELVSGIQTDLRAAYYDSRSTRQVVVLKTPSSFWMWLTTSAPSV